MNKSVISSRPDLDDTTTYTLAHLENSGENIEAAFFPMAVSFMQAVEDSLHHAQSARSLFHRFEDICRDEYEYAFEEGDGEIKFSYMSEIANELASPVHHFITRNFSWAILCTTSPRLMNFDSDELQNLITDLKRKADLLKVTMRLLDKDLDLSDNQKALTRHIGEAASRMADPFIAFRKAEAGSGNADPHVAGHRAGDDKKKDPYVLVNFPDGSQRMVRRNGRVAKDLEAQTTYRDAYRSHGDEAYSDPNDEIGGSPATSAYKKLHSIARFEKTDPSGR